MQNPEGLKHFEELKKEYYVNSENGAVLRIFDDEACYISDRGGSTTADLKAYEKLKKGNPAGTIKEDVSQELFLFYILKAAMQMMLLPS